jgi:hypothetical protein
MDTDKIAIILYRRMLNGEQVVGDQVLAWLPKGSTTWVLPNAASSGNEKRDAVNLLRHMGVSDATEDNLKIEVRPTQYNDLLYKAYIVIYNNENLINLDYLDDAKFIDYHELLSKMESPYKELLKTISFWRQL